jgi:hypothetical protein
VRSQDSVASCGPQGTAHSMIMQQKWRQVVVSLRGHVHGGLGLIARWRRTGIGARAQQPSSGAEGQESQGGDMRLISAADSAAIHGAAA